MGSMLLSRIPRLSSRFPSFGHLQLVLGVLSALLGHCSMLTWLFLQKIIRRPQIPSVGQTLDFQCNLSTRSTLKPSNKDSSWLPDTGSSRNELELLTTKQCIVHRVVLISQVQSQVDRLITKLCGSNEAEAVLRGYTIGKLSQAAEVLCIMVYPVLSRLKSRQPK